MTNPDEVRLQLESGEIVTLSLDQWTDLSSSVKILRTIDTGLSGSISILDGLARGVVVMEEPKPDERVLRRLSDAAAAEEFVAERLRLYDRMWDGCGCRVDYYR